MSKLKVINIFQNIWIAKIYKNNLLLQNKEVKTKDNRNRLKLKNKTKNKLIISSRNSPLSKIISSNRQNKVGC